MPLISFSTMWAQQDRFADLAHFRTVVAGFGYEAIEVSHWTNESGLAALLHPGEIPLSGLHAPAPLRRLPDGRNNNDADLAATDEAERAIAVAETLRTIDAAALAGLPYVVVHLGGIGAVMTDAERELRRLYDAGEINGPDAKYERDRLKLWRLARAQAHLLAAEHSLRQLVDHAAPRGVAIGLENRLHYHEIPHPAEALDLLADYPTDVAGYWHDVGHAEVQARLGLIEREHWFPALTSHTIGCHLHDVDGIRDHRAPGNGNVDWVYIAAGLPPGAQRVLEIDQNQPDDKVAAAIDFLWSQGIIQ